MPLLPRVGRRSLKMRLIIGVIYLLLALGSITMVYPFLMTLNGAVCNDWDYTRHSLFPRYFADAKERYMKFLAEKYLARDFILFQTAYTVPNEWTSFEIIRFDTNRYAHLPLAQVSSEEIDRLARITRDYEEWIEGYDPRNVLPMFDRYMNPRFQRFLRDRYVTEYLKRHPGASRRQRRAGALKLLNETWGEGRYTQFDYIDMTLEINYPYHLSQWLPPVEHPRYRDYMDFMKGLPAEWKSPITGQFLWTSYLEKVVGKFEEFRKETGLTTESLSRVRLPSAEPANPKLREYYREFIDTRWPLRLTRLPQTLADRYRDFLRKRLGEIRAYNKLASADCATWDDVPFPAEFPEQPLVRTLWRDFVRAETKPSERILLIPEMLYREFLRARYKTVDAVNKAYGWQLTSWDEIDIPLAEVDAYQFHSRSGRWMFEFLTFNFRRVFRFMAVQGRALFNTFVLVALTVLATLTINPMAAYALSRFRMRGSHKILLFCLATMAFPPEVIMIPNFLLLRDLGFLNTFAGLVLPGLANGFSIFLLKGFFDSLPPELYEAATIDGAGEWTIFWRVTLPLIKPILAYLSLLAFLGAYGGFMWAFLVCQDERMWTLMVWVYQFQQIYADFPYMSMAAFVLASVPTFAVFLLCQNVILRGIIIPTMK